MQELHDDVGKSRGKRKPSAMMFAAVKDEKASIENWLTVLKEGHLPAMSVASCDQEGKPLSKFSDWLSPEMGKMLVEMLNTRLNQLRR